MKKSLFQRIRVDRVILVNAGSLVGTTGVTAGLGFVYWWVAARQNTPAVVGFANAAISAMALLGSLGMLGLGTLLIGELPRHKGKEASLISAALILVGSVGACAGVLYALIASFFSASFRELGASPGNIVIFAAGVSLTSVTFVLDQAVIGLLRGEMQLWRNTVFAVVKLGALFAFDLLLSHVTGLTIYATLIIGNLASLLVLAFLGVTKHKLSLKSCVPEWKLLRQLGPSALAHHGLNITLQAPTQILPVLVTVMLSPTINGWFSVAWNLSSVSNTAVAALSSTLYAVSSAKPSVLAGKLRMTMVLALVACFLINAVLIFDPRLALGFFGHTYSQNAAFSLIILSVESFPFIIKSHYIAISRIRKQVKRSTMMTIVTGLLEVGGAAAGAHFGGLNGLSLGWFFAMCLEALLMAPTVYGAARVAKDARRISTESGVLAAQPTWRLSTINMPAISRSLGTEASWLLDTLAMSAIRPGITEANTLLLQQVRANNSASRQTPAQAPLAQNSPTHFPQAPARAFPFPQAPASTPRVFPAEAYRSPMPHAEAHQSHFQQAGMNTPPPLQHQYMQQAEANRLRLQQAEANRLRFQQEEAERLRLQQTTEADTLSMQCPETGAMHAQRAQPDTPSSQSLGIPRLRLQQHTQPVNSSDSGKMRIRPTRLSHFAPLAYKKVDWEDGLEHDYAEHNV